MTSGNIRDGASGDYLHASHWPTAGLPDVPGFAQLRLVGSGGSATVYKAVELRHDRPVAIKILDVQAGDSQRRAFAREVDAIARIEPHPNIVTLLGSGVTPNGHPYLVFPYFDGGTFAAWIDERGPLTWSAAIDISIKICSAVETVHRAGLIHRDVKPGNVFIGVTPAHPVLGDFGISTSVEGVPSRTVQQAVTVGYTAPEILHDKPPTTISDIYSLGMTIFRIIQGLHAYYAESPAAVMRNVLNQSEAPHLSAGVPPSLDEAVTRALAENPADRPQTAIELARQLQAIQADHYLPVTPVLVMGEPGVLGEEPLPTAYRAEPQDVSPEPSQDHAEVGPATTRADLSIGTAPPSLLDPVTDHTVDPSRPQPTQAPTVAIPERPDAGAILAAAVNPNEELAAVEANNDVSNDVNNDVSPIDRLTRPPVYRQQHQPAPSPDAGNGSAWNEHSAPELPRPGGQMAPNHPRQVRNRGLQHLPGSLDGATESRPRKTRAELLAPRADGKKKRWWSRRRRS